MIGTKLKDRSDIGSQAVRVLRKQRLSKGLPFMINAKLSEEFATYLEYPDGSIELVERSSSGNEFIPIETLSDQEAAELRSRYQLV